MRIIRGLLGAIHGLDRRLYDNGRSHLIDGLFKILDHP